MQQKMKLSILSMLMAVIMVASVFTGALSATATNQPGLFVITSPYANVDWATYGQYKADFHSHSTNSDGANTVAQMVEDHYAKGFDIFTVTDHSVLTPNWDKINGGVTSERKAEIEAGVGRDGRGMIDLDNCNEQSATDHINSFFAAYNDVVGGTRTMASTIAAVEAAGGITHINHPGRYTGGAAGGTNGAIASNNPTNIQKYVDLFLAYPSLVGMEIVNKDDNESRSDKILWDNILTQTMPQDRFVWGFANDDTHSLGATGYTWNVMLMPELTQSQTRISMETGTFYTVSRIDRREGINAMNLALTTPSITNIVVEGNTIAITGVNYDVIEWISGVDATTGMVNVIATGASIDVSNYADIIENTNYVRAQLKSQNGIAYTQPFGVKNPVPATVTLNGVTDVIVGNDAAYTVSVSDVSKLATVTLQFEVDGAYFSGKSFTGLNGFDVLGDVVWTQTGNGVWIGRAILVNLNGGVSTTTTAGSLDIFEMVFSSNSDLLGITDVRLVSAVLSGYDTADVAVYIDSLIANCLVQTSISQYFSIYDVNRDGVVDQLDLTAAQLFFMTKEGDANWSAAKVADVNGDGCVDIEDLILILKNITW
ncbi:MAG: dockerin type I domain-containing protein [Candidatus Bathyarchaeota archaeon]|nr:dockerin type I domain-containing protein [Candidatus Termiticorpusculum sp.]